jgi:sigma-B regulation protein RsbU (phosphoserine phosphatase)
LPAGDGLVGRAFSTGSAELVADVRKDSAHDSHVDASSGFHTISTATVPVMIGTQRFGAIQAINRLEPAGAVSFQPADLALLETLATSLALAIANVELTRNVVSDSLLARDLEQARQAQDALMPDDDPAGHIAGMVIPARNLSGDFFDHMEINGRIAFCQGDVSGKGIAASLMMARTVALFRQLARQGLDCPQIVNHMNAELIDAGSDRFVSLIIGWLDPTSGNVQTLNCGHGPAVFCPSHEPHVMFPAQTIPLGIKPFDLGDLRPIELTLGDGYLYLATDGITEAKWRERELGVNGFAALATNVPGRNAAEKLHRIMDQFEQGNLTTHDDATLLVLAGQPCASIA